MPSEVESSACFGTASATSLHTCITPKNTTPLYTGDTLTSIIMPPTPPITHSHTDTHSAEDTDRAVADLMHVEAQHEGEGVGPVDGQGEVGQGEGELELGETQVGQGNSASTCTISFVARRISTVSTSPSSPEPPSSDENTQHSRADEDDFDPPANKV